MKDSRLISAGRRRFMRGAGGLMTLPALSPAFPLTLHASPRAAARELAPLAAGKGLVLYREGDPHGQAFAEVMAGAGARVRVLGIDPVRQWRDGLGAEALEGGLPLLGLGNWTDFLLVSGLAAEQRRHPLLQWQHPLPAGGGSAWAADHARALLALAPLAETEEIQAALELAGAEPGADTDKGARKLFSWIIA